MRAEVVIGNDGPYAGDYEYIGPAIRIQTGAHSCYFALLVCNYNEGITSLDVYKFIAGTSTLLSANPMTLVTGNKVSLSA
ncbi:hypothetical protein OEK97_28715, partial [Escherichia coli]|uniref:hypothetical protein n=1 Tax=Escherichia coli TaxID=562 RepID=UPI0021D9C15F